VGEKHRQVTIPFEDFANVEAIRIDRTLRALQKAHADAVAAHDDEDVARLSAALWAYTTAIIRTGRAERS